MVGIIDYGVGNLFSLCSSFKAIGEEAFVSGDPEKLRQADRLVLPGVGAFEDAIGHQVIGGFGVACVHHQASVTCEIRFRRRVPPEADGTARSDRGQATLNRDTDCLSSSAVLDSSRTICAVERVPSPVCSVTAKIC